MYVCTYTYITKQHAEKPKLKPKNRNYFPTSKISGYAIVFVFGIIKIFLSVPPVFTTPSITHRLPRFPDSSSNLQVQPSWSWEIPDPDVKSKTKTQKHRNTRSMREKCNLFMPKRNYAWNLYEIRGSRLTICCCLCAFAMSEMEIKIDKSWGK